jgi:drug/metabolite transporter (DMT)-like permease
MALIGANVGAAKLLAEVLPILLIACLRCILACLVLWPLAHALERRLRPGLAGLLVFHSLTASVICLLLWYAGLRRVPAGVAGCSPPSCRPVRR